ALLGEAFRETLDRLALVEAGTVDDHELARARRNRVEFLQCHRSVPYSPVATSIDWPSARVTTAFFTSLWRPMVPRNRFTLPLRRSVFTAVTLTPNSASTAALISGFVA